MSLKPVLDSLDQVDESLRPHYTSNSDGKFILTLDGQLPNYVDQVTHNEQLNKVTEFRNNNIQLLEERDGLKQLAEKAQAFGAITPEEAHAAIQQRQELESKGVKKSSDVQAVVDAALARFKDTEFKAVQAQLTATNEARKVAEQQVTEQQMTASIGQVFKAAGGQDGAEAFIVSRARDKFEIQDGVLQAKTGQYSIEKPGEPLPLEEWMVAQTKEVGFAFGRSSGTGTPPDAGGMHLSVPTGVKLLIDPSPQELGQYGHEIASGQMRVVTAKEAASMNGRG